MLVTPTLAVHPVFMELVLCTGVSSCPNRFGLLGFSEGNSATAHTVFLERTLMKLWDELETGLHFRLENRLCVNAVLLE